MPSIHPSEDPPLGWFVPCLSVTDLTASLEWYAALDLRPCGGDPGEGWAMLRNRASEIHLFEGHIEKDLLNYRGGDPDRIRPALAERGLEPVAVFGPRSFIYRDPDGRDVFFDTTEEETRAYAAGRPLTAEVSPEEVHAGDGLDLGNLAWCLNCRDLAATSGFYERLGYSPGGGDPTAGWSILVRPDHPAVFGQRMTETGLGLFAGMFPTDLLAFRGGNVGSIAATLGERGLDLGEDLVTGPDGGESLLLSDPDGRAVLFDTTPPERLAP